MKKTLDPTAIANELKGQSRYFEPQTAESSQLPEGNERTNSRTPKHSHERTDERSQLDREGHRYGPASARASRNRVIVRYSFQFYADQIDAIKRLRAQLELDGQPYNLSELAREAFSAYLERMTEGANE